MEKELNWIVAYLFLMMVKILGFGHLAYNKSLHILIIFGMTYEGNGISKQDQVCNMSICVLDKVDTKSIE